MKIKNNALCIESLNVLHFAVQETTKLRQIIEVRESKLFDLSKENLNLQETNAILRRYAL